MTTLPPVTLDKRQRSKLKRLFGTAYKELRGLDYAIAPLGVDGAYQRIERVRGALVQLERALGIWKPDKSGSEGGSE